MKKLTDSLEDELLAQIELRGSLTDKKLCERYDISRVGLWKAVQRAKQRRGTGNWRSSKQNANRELT